MIRPAQIDLFGEAPSLAPVVAGFDYWANVLSAPEQTALVAALQTLAFKPYEHLGYLGHRRIAPSTARATARDGRRFFRP